MNRFVAIGCATLTITVSAVMAQETSRGPAHWTTSDGKYIFSDNRGFEYFRARPEVWALYIGGQGGEISEIEAISLQVQATNMTISGGYDPRFSFAWSSDIGEEYNIHFFGHFAEFNRPNGFYGLLWNLAEDKLAFGYTNGPTHLAGTQVRSYVQGITNDVVGRMFVQTGLRTVTNTTSATTLLSGIGQTNLQANAVGQAMNIIGRTLRFDFAGRYSTAATPGTFTIEVALGGTTVFSSGAITPAVSQTEKTWRLQGQITTRTTGASGTVMGWGNFTVGTNTTGVSIWPMLNATTSTIDLTAAQDIHARATMSASTAPNNIQCQVGSIYLE